MPAPVAPSASDEAVALIKPQVRALAGYTLAAPSARRKLNQNESPYDVPEALKAQILERARAAPWHRYPAFTPQDLLERLGRRHDWTPDGVLVGNGSNELIQAALAVTVGPETAVVSPVPTFTLYRLLTLVNGGRFIGVPLARDFAFDIPALVAAARAEQARVVVLNSPNNPTGSVVPADAVERLLDETGALIVVDEAYQDFGGPTAVPLLRRHPRLVVLRTFSKAMALAGLRFGYALAHPAVAAQIAKAKLPYNVNQITLAAAHVMLDHAPEFARRVAMIRAERSRLEAGLQRMRGLRVFPSEANFVLIRCESAPAATVFQRLVDEWSILVRDVSAGPGLAECLRITAGEPADVDAVLEALARIFGSAA
jgi:histidinol-phosphate aminotransferase